MMNIDKIATLPTEPKSLRIKVEYTGQWEPWKITWHDGTVQTVSGFDRMVKTVRAYHDAHRFEVVVMTLVTVDRLSRAEIKRMTGKGGASKQGWVDAHCVGGYKIEHQHKDGSWWFFDEKYLQEYGPFDDKESAVKECAEYTATLKAPE